MRIISLATTLWSSRWMNRQQLMSRIGQRHTVLYSNASWFTWDVGGPQWRDSGWRDSIEHVDNVWLERVPRWMVRSPRSALVDRSVLRLHAARWRRWLLERGQGPLVLYLFEPAFADYLPYVAADLVVYHPYDRFELMPGWTARLEERERTLLRAADAVITPSETFSAVLAAKSDRAVHVVPNGVDVALFAAAREAGAVAPPDLSSIPRPRIGYLGWLERHVDLSLVADLAARRPDWHFVFVGGQTPNADERLLREVEVCKRMQNIHFLGAKLRTEIPAYMLNMDVNTICWRLEDGSWADFGYPLKLQEYLASGRPIVSADLHSVRTRLAHVIGIARNADEWQAAIEFALTSGGPGQAAERIAIAADSGWDRRCQQIETILHSLPANGR